LIGRPFDEETLFTVAHVIEEAKGKLPVKNEWWV
jgi:aspartyl-tRNA(Asn)/glutamyl-tRNA(Gln) amidotransferase subunit A